MSHPPNSSAFLAALAALAPLAGGASAQAQSTSLGGFQQAHAEIIPGDPTYGTFGGQAESFPLSGTWPEETIFGRSLIAQLTSDQVADAVVLVGTRLVILSGPDVYAAVIDPARRVIDAAVLPGMSPDGRDALAVTAQRGLSLAWWDEENDKLGQRLLSAPDWDGTLLVRSADLDQSGTVDLVGLGDDGRTVRSLLADDPAGSSFSEGTGFVLGGSATELLPLQWDGSGPLELAFLTDLGLEVYDRLGNLLELFEFFGPGDVLVVLHESRLGYDRLAWVNTGADDASQFLWVIDQTGVEGPLQGGPLEVVSGAAADYDMDGDDDLFLVHRTNHEALYLENLHTAAQPLGPTFSAGIDGLSFFNLGPPGPNPSQGGWPSFGDLDGDGDPDLFVPVQSTGTAHVLSGETVPHEAYLPEVLESEFEVFGPITNGELTLIVKEPDVIPPGNLELELAIWQQEDGVRGGNAPVSYDLHYFPLGTGWPPRLTFELPETEHYFASIYHLELRMVERDGSGELVEAYPAYMGFLTMSLPVAWEYEALGLTSGPLIPVGVTGFINTQQGDLIPASLIGGAVGKVPQASFLASMPKKKIQS